MATIPFDYGFSGEGGGLFIPDNYKFANQGAADSYFQSHLDELERQSTFIMVGSVMKVWMGLTKPALYSSADWQDGNALIAGKDGVAGKDGTTIIDNLKTDEVPVWDATKGKFISSGVTADDGEITMSPNTLFFGNHSMESSVENVLFRNTFSGRLYAPVWQELGVSKGDAFIRSYGAVERFVRVPDGTIDVTNPVNVGITIDADEAFLGGTFILTNNTPAVAIEVIDKLSGKVVWRQKLGDLTAGRKTITFTTPLDVKAGYQYDMKLFSEKGDLVAKSNASTGFSWTISRVKWSDLEVATKPWVLANGGSGAAPAKTITEVARSQDGTSLIFTHLDGSTTTVVDNGGASAESVTALSNEVNAMQAIVNANKVSLTNIETDVNLLKAFMTASENAYVYSGATPNPPANLRSYVILATNGAGFTLPITDNGAMVMVQSSATSFNVLSPPSTTVDNKLSVRVQSNSNIMFVKVAGNWVSVNFGKTPQTYTTISKNIQVDLADKLHSFDDIDVEMARRGYTRNGTPPVVAPFYGVFGTTWPATLTGATQSSGNRVTITKNTDERQRAFLIIPIARASAVTGMREGSGIASLWSSNDITIGGEQYRAYVSTNAMAERSATFTVTFS